jgi:GNAT superfamily N-acetyltransferase
MSGPIELIQLHGLPSELEVLRTEAARQGFKFVDRLVADWASGANRFDRRGERLLGAFAGEGLIGVGGLSIDPYAGRPDVGRLRHLYVLQKYRRRGVGGTLVDSLLRHARGTFGEVRLRTDTDEAAAFYTSCGFTAIAEATASHRLHFVALK